MDCLNLYWKMSYLSYLSVFTTAEISWKVILRNEIVFSILSLYYLASVLYLKYISYVIRLILHRLSMCKREIEFEINILKLEDK